MNRSLYPLTFIFTLLTSIFNFNMHAEMVLGYAAKTAPVYITRVVFPATVKNIPTICGYYKGYSLKFNSNYCVLPEDQIRTYFPLVITQEVQQIAEGKNVKYLERIPNKPCKLFHIRHTDDKKWSIELELEKTLPLRLPAEALILLMNPDHIDSLKKSDESADTDESSVLLPSIIIKPTITAQQLTAQSTDSLLAAFDSKSVHRPVKEAILQQGSVVLSMRTGG
ncbi:hypothetical protein H0X48_00815 [Candidatus Dependentiae bacterium]|nr:hypothetical protein [Candidatus Dependentiae bacterium]